MCLAVLGLAEGWCTNAWVAFVLPILTRIWAMPEHFEADVHSFSASGVKIHGQNQYQLVLLLNGLGHLIASLVYAPLADRCGRPGSGEVSARVRWLKTKGIQLNLGRVRHVECSLASQCFGCLLCLCSKPRVGVWRLARSPALWRLEGHSEAAPADESLL